MSKTDEKPMSDQTAAFRYCRRVTFPIPTDSADIIHCDCSDGHLLPEAAT